MKKVGKPWFFIVAILIVALSYLTFFGIYIPEKEPTTDDPGKAGTVSVDTVSGDTVSGETVSGETVSGETASDATKPAAEKTVREKCIIRGVKDIRWGIDIQGGVNVTFGPAENEESVTKDQLKAVKETLDLRLLSNNVTDYEMYVDEDNKRIMISFPWVNGETRDVDETISELAATANLWFVSGYVQGYQDPTSGEVYYFVSSEIGDDGAYYFTDVAGTKHKLLLTGSDIDKAELGYDNNNLLCVDLAFNAEGAGRFAQATSECLNDYISICLDGVPISQPTVNSVISDGKASITNPTGFTAEEGQKLVNYINSGALAFTLETKDYDMVDATLGKDSLKAMMLAGIIAFIVICAFMIAYYRLPGFVACIALLGQAAGSLAAVSGFFAGFDSFTLTLPGIAGIILSIGMGVDANIITNERIREEVLKGKTLDGAIDSGNENSFSSIFDGNITVIIVAIILMGVFGPPDTLWSWILKPFMWMFPTATTGAIYSFGYTLLVGVIFNFVMGVTASRIMLKSLSRFAPFRSRKLYGGVVK